MARAFLLGAGVSRAEYNDAPLSEDFLYKLSQKNPKLYENIDEAINNFSHKNANEYNVEELMIESEKLPESNRNSFITALYRAIYELLVDSTSSSKEFISKFLDGTIKPAPKISLLNTLLNDSRLNTGDFFMTLNYDLYLDREILLHQDKIDYGLDNKFIYSIDTKIGIVNNQQLSVYHLHGSLNWGMTNNSSLNISLGAIPPKKPNDLCLIPPGKKDFNPILRAIWDIAKMRLETADELVIIGCSLNPKDKELINMIKEFKDSKGEKRIKYIDYPNKNNDKFDWDLTFGNAYSPTLNDFGLDKHKFNYYGEGFFLHAKTEYEQLNKAKNVIEFIYKPPDK